MTINVLTRLIGAVALGLALSTAPVRKPLLEAAPYQERGAAKSSAERARSITTTRLTGCVGSASAAQVPISA